MQEQIVATLESAASYVVGETHDAEVQALIDRLSAEPWWDEAVARQQT